MGFGFVGNIRNVAKRNGQSAALGLSRCETDDGTWGCSVVPKYRKEGLDET